MTCNVEKKFHMHIKTGERPELSCEHVPDLQLLHKKVCKYLQYLYSICIATIVHIPPHKW